MKKDREEKGILRPPVVTVVGHVDHGKSTLIDYIRKTNVVESEAGGITQHVSAYEIEPETKEGSTKKITFIDTPGHEAFGTLRKRGASIADIVILVVSAIEGVKPQTEESIKFILELKVPFIVAINKIDHPSADPQKVSQQLAEYQVYLEGYGGDVPNVAISAKTGEGIPELLDIILLISELEEFKGNRELPGSGFILESRINPKTGVAALLIIKDGSLKTNQFIVIDNIVSKIKRIEDFKGQATAEAGPSSPVWIYGIERLPKVNSIFHSFKTKEEAEEATKEARLERDEGVKETLDPDQEKIALVPIVIKADVLGSLEVIEKEVKRLETEKVKFKIIQRGVGDISENDAKAVSGSNNPIVIGFNIKVDKRARELFDRYAVVPALFNVIYKIEEYLTPLVLERTPRSIEEEVIARASIIKLFSKTKNKQVVGAKVAEGVFREGKEVNIIRNNAPIGKGRLKELQVEKKKVKQVEKGNFGATIETKVEVALRDTLAMLDFVEK